MNSNNAKLIKVVLLIIGLGISLSISQVQSDITGSATTFSLQQTISNSTVWQDRFETYDITDPFTVHNGGNFTIVNSHIALQGIIDTEAQDGGDLQENGIVVRNGGVLIIRNSIIETQNQADHTIFGATTGTIILDNATLSSVNGDAFHLENNYDLTVTGSTFQNSGDDGFHVEGNNLPVVVQNSRIINNGDDGFDIAQTTGNIVFENSLVQGNNGDGVKLVEVGNATIINTIVDYTGATDPDNRGVDVDDSNQLNLIDVYIHGFTSDGMKIVRTSVDFNNVTVENSGDEGIEIESTESNNPITLNNVNVINANGGDGIKIERVTGTVILNNTQVINANDDGIQITLGNTTSYIHNTYVTGSYEDGFELDGSHYLEMVNVNSSENNENGIKFKNLGDLFIQNLAGIANGVFAIDILNASSLQGISMDLRNNLGGGLKVVSTPIVNITDSTFEANMDQNAESPGIDFESVNDFTIHESNIVSNSGSGFILINSNGTIEASNINSNQLDGITAIGNSKVTIISNTISNNQRDGVSLSSGAYATIKYNTFTGNGRYGVFADLQEGNSIDISENYWGSDEGPIWQGIGEGGRDGVFGQVIISSILDISGNSLSYSPPQEVNYQTILFIVFGLISIIALGYIIWRYNQQRNWIQEAKPLALIYISRVGIPLHEYIIDEKLVDSSLISGFLSATSSFGSELRKGDSSVKSHRKVRELQQKSNVILIYFMEGSMISLIVENSNPLLIKALEDFGDTFVVEAMKLSGEELDTKVEKLSVEYFETLTVQKFAKFLNK